jgi:hypothetical protein
VLPLKCRSIRSEEFAFFGRYNAAVANSVGRLHTYLALTIP